MSQIFADSAVSLSLQIKNDSLTYLSRHKKAVALYVLGDLNRSLECFIENKGLAKKLNQNSKIIESLNAIGNLYVSNERFDNAKLTYHEARAYSVFTKNKVKKCLVESNLAIMYSKIKQNDSAIFYSNLVINNASEEQAKNLSFMGNIYGTLLSAYSEMQNKDSVAKYAEVVLQYYKNGGDLLGYAGTLYNIGTFYYKLKNTETSLKYFELAYKANPDNVELAMSINKALGDVYYELKKYIKSAEFYNTAFFLKDSVNKLRTVEKLSEMEVKYETGKKEEELKRLSAEQEISALKIKQSRTLTLVSVFSVIVFLVIAGVLYKQNKNKKQANALLQKQNDEITHQKKEITDSINYAKRIQLSILPPDKMVKRLLPDAFIFYKPKDVVSGDFYWVEEKNNLVMFAAVDCTGHGVPGAMMSVVGMSLLNRAVNEKDLTKPSDILQHLDMGVTDTLRQNQEDNAVKDGMDLSLCTYNAHTKELQFAGAFNNLWIVRKNFSSSHKITSDKEIFFEDSLLEIKADKFPIGSNTDGVADNYTNHKIQLQKGDYIYLYSDGFADQFGGPKGKKFKYNALKKLLISIHDLSPAQQHEAIKTAYENWRGNLEQIDDILVIGVRV
ncbi:MAG: SpoIIE family protein phosphatase [Bacteroidia bacterium]|nr:SpoIIE family protein phosphatase [Bacteroidia bacterium]